MRHHDDMDLTRQALDHQFVEYWAERYRCGAENSRWRAGPRLKEAMEACPDLEVLAGITNYWDFEMHIFETIGPAVRKRGSYTLPEFLTVGYWKTPRQLSNYRRNEGVPIVTRDAFASDVADIDRPDALLGLRGVRVPVASALLTVWNPDTFTIIDVWALKALTQLGESIGEHRFSEHGRRWWENHYDLYVRACQGVVARVKPLTLRDVDRALWKWGQLNVPR